jgi:hypothetical protein
MCIFVPHLYMLSRICNLIPHDFREAPKTLHADDCVVVVGDQEHKAPMRKFSRAANDRTQATGLRVDPASGSVRFDGDASSGSSDSDDDARPAALRGGDASKFSASDFFAQKKQKKKKANGDAAAAGMVNTSVRRA